MNKISSPQCRVNPTKVLAGDQKARLICQQSWSQTQNHHNLTQCSPLDSWSMSRETYMRVSSWMVAGLVRAKWYLLLATSTRASGTTIKWVIRMDFTNSKMATSTLDRSSLVPNYSLASTDNLTGQASSDYSAKASSLVTSKTIWFTVAVNSHPSTARSPSKKTGTTWPSKNSLSSSANSSISD